MIASLKYKCSPGLFQKVVFQKKKKKKKSFQKVIIPKFAILYKHVTFLCVKTVRNNEPLEYRSTYMPFEGELSKLLARLLLVLLIYVQELGLGWG